MSSKFKVQSLKLWRLIPNLKFQVSSFGFIIIYSMLSVSLAFSQTDKKFIRDGNKQYKDKKYSDSEINYRKSLEKNKNSTEGIFNLGDAFYKQGKYEEAASQFQNITSKNTDKETLAKAYHNLGNSMLQAKKYEESIKAYKNALKNYAEDKDTKYNLAYAQSMLKQQQQQQQQNKDNKEKDNKNQEQKNNQDKKDNKDKKEEQKDNKDKQQEQSQANQQQKISKEDAERMLQALNNQEKDAQKKLQKKQAVRVKIEKDW